MQPSGGSRTRARARSPFVGIALVLSLLAGVVGISSVVAGAATSVSPSGPGAIGTVDDTLVRDEIVNLTVDGALAYKKANAAGNYAPLNLGLASILDLAGCAGDNGAATPAGTGNRSPWTKVHVTGPNGFTFDWYSPAISATALSAPFNPVVPQPAGPATNSYRGATPPAQGGVPFELPLELGDAGVYTVTTTARNMIKTGLGTCAVGTPTPNGTGGFTSVALPAGSVLPGGGIVMTDGLVIEQHDFEYRPWQQVFTDIGGQGTVSFNVTPAESQLRLGNVTGAIVPGHMAFYAAPGLGAFALPADPSGCATDPSSCLPANAVACDPGAGCEPRLVVISRSGQGSPTETLQGIFDLETRAFIASTRIGFTSRTLFSLGTELDGYYSGLIPQLQAAADALGIDISELLATGVILRNANQEWTISLLNGLQIDPSSGPAGIGITTAPGAQAGLILDVYAAISPNACTSQSASSAAGDLRFQRTASVGYNVEKSDLLPDVPKVAGLDALGVGGPIFHIESDRRNVAPVANLTMALVGAEVDTDIDAPALLDVHYLLDAANAAATPMAPRTTDFLGTATWAASETNLGALGCLTVDFMLGLGVMLINNVLPIGFGDIPIWDENPAAAALVDSIEAAVQTVTDVVTTNPTVAGLLDTILANVEIPEV